MSVFRDVDKGARKLVTELRALETDHVRVGIQGKEASAEHVGGGGSMVAIATYQEFGTATIPERSFIRATVDENAEEIGRLQKRLVELIAKGKITRPKALELLGQKIVALVQKRIRDRIPPPLTPETVQRKGSSVPLIDKGQLVQSITFRVVPASADKGGGT